MVGIHFELIFHSEGSPYDGRYCFTSYALTLDEAKAWGETKAWNFIHADHPARRVLKSLKTGQVANYLLTEHGSQPLNFHEVRKLIDDRTLDELKAFGLRSNAYVRPAQTESSTGQIKSELLEPVSLVKLHAEMEARFAPSTQEYVNVLLDDNWDPGKECLYILLVSDEASGQWGEVVYCKAVNLHHAGRLWAWHSRKRWGRLRPANLGLAFGFSSPAEPSFPPQW